MGKYVSVPNTQYEELLEGDHITKHYMSYSKENFNTIQEQLHNSPDDSELQKQLGLQKAEMLALAQAEAEIEDRYFDERKEFGECVEAFQKISWKLQMLNPHQSMFSGLKGVSEVLLDQPREDGTVQIGISYPHRDYAGDPGTPAMPELFVCELTREGRVQGLDRLPEELRGITEPDILSEVVRYANEMIPEGTLVVDGGVVTEEQEPANEHEKRGGDYPPRVPYTDRQFRYLRQLPGFLFEVKSNRAGFAGTYRAFVYPEFVILESHVQGNATYYQMLETPIDPEEFDAIVSANTGNITQTGIDLNTMLEEHGYQEKSRMTLRDEGLRHSRNHPRASRDGQLLDEEVRIRQERQYYAQLYEQLRNTPNAQQPDQ